MTGEQGSEKVDARLEQVEAILSEYEKSLGLLFSGQPEVAKYLSLNKSQLNKMSPEECGEISYMLAQQSLYIQHEINKHSQRVNWCKTNIDVLVANQVDNYGGKYTTYENRKILAIKDDGYMSKLYQVMVRAQQVVDRLTYLPPKIGYMSKTLNELQQTKRRA